MTKDSFIIYKSFYKPISRLSDKQLGRLFRAIFKYQLGEEVTVEEDIDMALGFFINQFEIDETKYHGIVERNRNNGRKGGAPIGNCNAKSKQPNSLNTTNIASWVLVMTGVEGLLMTRPNKAGALEIELSGLMSSSVLANAPSASKNNNP